MRLVRMVLLVLAAGAAMKSGVAASPHPMSAATQAALAREARQLLAQPGVAHVGFYGFTVDHAGHVLDEWVVRPSGKPALDRMALATIAKAVLKRLPPHAPPHVQFVIPIAFRRDGAMSGPLGKGSG